MSSERVITELRRDEPVRGKREGPPSQFLTYLRDHRFPNLKTLNLSVFFGRHASGQDAKDSLLHAASADIIIPECLFWNSAFEEECNEIANGNLSPKQSDLKNPFYASLIEGIYNTHKRIVFADVSETHPQAQSIKNAYEKVVGFVPNIHKFKWNRKPARTLLFSHYERYDKMLPARGDFIFQNICPAIDHSVDYDPELSNKRVLEVSMFLGSEHESVAGLIKNVHSEVLAVRQDENSRTALTYSEEVRRATLFDAPVSESLKDALLIETIIGVVPVVNKYTTTLTPSVGNSFLRSAVNSFTDDEREHLHELVMRNDPSLFGYVTGQLQGKGLMP